ncbi:autotransporter outer membrane beta-barrel domain-containing protein [Nitratireductor luteus]|uniref:autotransporter outer membrane beta-barrel domain-containing protein n=1 Tax=Nitratireductor luteus TaxID=2976980 RepID=UPI00223ED65E|nr:autotransporter outer membrane beta-barrel domain-containing protein [Nitratireductor luteus]
MANIDTPDRRAAFSRQNATATKGRMRQLGLVNKRLTGTRDQRLRGRNAHSSELAVRFRGGIAKKSAVLETEKHIAAEKDRRTERIAVWFGGDLLVDGRREHDPRASILHTNGIVFGADMRLGPRLLVGNAIGTGFDRSAFGRTGSLGSRYISDTLYASYFTSANSYLDLALGAAAMDFSTAYDDFGSGAAGRRNGTQMFASARYSRDFRHGRRTLRPYGQTAISWSNFDGYVYQGAHTLRHEARSSYQAAFTAGISASRTFTSRLGTFQPRAKVEMQWRRTRNSRSSIHFESDGERFSTAATGRTAGSFSFSAGMDWSLGKHTSAGASYKLSAGFTDDAPKQTLGAKLRMKF